VGLQVCPGLCDSSGQALRQLREYPCAGWKRSSASRSPRKWRANDASHHHHSHVQSVSA
jgi:hypothetical protein